MEKHVAFGLATIAAATLFSHGALADTKATFACKGGKTIAADFGTNSVALKLSDGRSLTLPQAMSGSGARYANADETLVFWNKGDTAFITEGPGEGKETYSGCVVKN